MSGLSFANRRFREIVALWRHDPQPSDGKAEAADVSFP
jgi:hypothetical protein